VPHEHVGRGEIGAVERSLQILDVVARVVHPRPPAAVADPGAVVGTRPRGRAQLRLHVLPALHAGPDFGFQHDGRAARSEAPHKERAPAADLDDTIRTVDCRRCARRARRPVALGLRILAAAACRGHGQDEGKQPARHRPILNRAGRPRKRRKPLTLQRRAS
jgi:hypothetical protein